MERFAKLLVPDVNIFPGPSITVALTHTIGCMRGIVSEKRTRIGIILFLNFPKKPFFFVFFIGKGIS